MGLVDLSIVYVIDRALTNHWGYGCRERQQNRTRVQRWRASGTRSTCARHLNCAEMWRPRPPHPGGRWLRKPSIDWSDLIYDNKGWLTQWNLGTGKEARVFYSYSEI